MSKTALTQSAFSNAYRTAVREIKAFLNDEGLRGLGRHNPGWLPDRFDFGAYLDASERRYQMVVAMIGRSAGGFEPGMTVLEVGGFLGAFPLALARLGFRDAVQRYDSADGAFNRLQDRLIFIAAARGGLGYRLTDADASSRSAHLPFSVTRRRC